MWGRKKAPIKIHGEQTVFNIVGKDICGNLIAKHLHADDIVAMMHTSWSTRQLFKSSPVFKRMKYASYILKAVMMGDRDLVIGNLRNISEIYGDNILELLVCRTRGTEDRGTRWEAISAIEFAAYAGDFSDVDVNNKFVLNYLLNIIPIEHRHHAIAQLLNIIENGSKQYGQLRGVCSAVLDLNARYTIFLNKPRLMRKKYWLESVVPFQEKLPESILRVFCDPISWDGALPDFKKTPYHLAVIRDGLVVDGMLPLTDKFGLCHSGGANPGARSAKDEFTVHGHIVEVATRDRDVLAHYHHTKLAQLLLLIKQHLKLIAEYQPAVEKTKHYNRGNHVGS